MASAQGITAQVGAQITSTESAVQGGSNRFTTKTLSTQDLNDTAHYSGKAVGLGVGVGGGGSVSGGMSGGMGGGAGPGLQGGSIGLARDTGSASSSTQAAITGMAGNSKARSGQIAKPLAKPKNGEALQRQLQAQSLITQTFGKEASKAVADYASAQLQRIQSQQRQEAQADNPNLDTLQALINAKAAWEEGGAYRVALHTVVGALGGGLPGAAGAGTAAAAAPSLNALQDHLAQSLEDAGLNPTLAKASAQAIAGTAAAGLGAIASGGRVVGAATAVNADLNNRQLHPTEIQWIKSNAKRYAQNKTGKANPSQAEITAAEQELAQQAFRQVQFGVEGGAQAWNEQASAFLKQAGQQLLAPDPSNPSQGPGYLFYATPEQRADATLYLTTLIEHGDFYAQNTLQQSTAQSLGQAAQRDATIRGKLKTATQSAAAASATLALAGLAPTLLEWALSNPIAATQAGIISAETAASIVSGAVSPAGLLQQVQQSPKAAQVVYNRLAAAATQRPLSKEVVLGRYIKNSPNSYEQVAEARQSTYFQVAAWEGISKELGSREKLWEVNKAFLDKAIAEGKQFVFTEDPQKILKMAPESFSRREIDYLKNFFKFEERGGLWYGVKK